MAAEQEQDGVPADKETAEAELAMSAIAGPSTGKAPSSQQMRRKQNRLSVHSPYPSRGSPRTPRRTPAAGTSNRRSTLMDGVVTSPTSPQSPSMRALNAIVSLISPFSTARKSAAFGDPDLDEDDVSMRKDEEVTEEDVEDEDDVADQLYPPLPSEPRQIIYEDDRQEDEDRRSGGEEQDEVYTESHDRERQEKEEEKSPGEQPSIIEQTGGESEDEAQSLGDESMSPRVEVIEPQPTKASTATSTINKDNVGYLSAPPPRPAFGEPSAIGLSSSQEQTSSFPHFQSNSTLPPARSPFQSSAFAAPRFSTPSKMGFGAVASEPVESSFNSAPAQTKNGATVAPTNSFTFGATDALSSTPALPPYPRPTRTPKVSSPLAKNYELLARFFAEKAEQEAKAEASTSQSSTNDDGDEPSGGLTEIEMAGCMRLIEQSFARGQGAEIERLRRDALERGRMHDVSHMMDEEEADFANARGAHTRTFLSRSPSLPLGAAAGEPPVGQYSTRSRPSSSFLAPTYQRNEDAMINRSLAATFGAAPASAPKRRHRPLYLGPGVGASASSAIFRRNQQAQARRGALNTHRAAQQARLAAGQAEAEQDRSEGPSKRRKLPGEREDGPALFASSSAGDGQAQSNHQASVNQSSLPSAALRPEKRSAQASSSAAATPARTATADAMLSILSSGPSIPLRSSATHAKATAVPEERRKPINPEIVNPYETRSRFSRRTSTAQNTSSLAQKEKERLREEREKRQKLMKEREARKESTLDFIQRTAPSPHAKKGRRIRLEEDKEDEKEKQAAKAEAEAEEHRKRSVEEERRRKNEELKRRTELLTRGAKSNGQEPTPVDGNKSTSSGDEGQKDVFNFSDPAKSQRGSAPSFPASKPFSFNAAFAPKKPSPLSQAASNMAPDSPSGSSEASERDTVKSSMSPSKFGLSAPTSTVEIIDEDDGDKEAYTQVNGKSSTTGFSFAATSASNNSSTPAPFNFSSKPLGSAAPTSVAPVGSPSISLATSASSPTAPATDPISAPDASHLASSTPASARDKALNTPASSLPKFDFALNVVLPTSAASADSDVNSARKAALETATTALPAFDFTQGRSSTPASTTVSSSAPVPVTTATTAPTGFSFSALKPNGTDTGVPSAMSFKPVAPSHTAPIVPKGTSDDPPATTGNEEGGAAGKTTSALLSGSGEGEQDEDCLHEVRCKVWSLAQGKWSDLGIGMFRIKKNKVTAKQRVLVRNEGNGKVTVNFNILPSLKPNQDKNVISFLGFDATGKPMSYRCKIKTEDGARQLKEALEKSAKEVAAA